MSDPTESSPLPPLPAPLRRQYRDTVDGRLADNLLDLDDGARALDPGGIQELAAWGYLGGRRTLLQGVERVFEPWELAPPDVHPADLAEPAERADRLWDLLLAATEAALAGATAPRCALSGGLDSRAIAAAAATLRPDGLTLGTFGDPDCIDHPVAAELAAALKLPHEVTLLDPAGAAQEEERVWRATSGTGGPDAAPGAPTDVLWATQCDRLLSGCAGDVVWGSSVRPGPSPVSRLKRLGIVYEPPEWLESGPPPAPDWVSPAGAAAWANLWTRQQGASWNGVLPRLPHTPVVPVAWNEPLLAFCLALPAVDRQDRRLLRLALVRHAPAVATDVVPAVKGPGVHDLDRAWRESPVWQAELQRWIAPGGASEAAFKEIGLHRKGVLRLVQHQRRGRRDRAQFLSRLRALWRWGLRRVS